LPRPSHWLAHTHALSLLYPPCRSYGAAGDGQKDDTAALQRALAEVQSGVILIPAGVYVISNIIDHRKPIVLRGEGTDKTILYFTNSLTDIKGNSWRNGVSDYAHSDALINIRG